MKLLFDETGNFFYVISEQKIAAFSFYEMRMVSYMELSLKNKFVNPIVSHYFTKEDADK